MIIYFTWSEFDKSVEQIANKCRFKEFSGIYGVPRGGLCLAVALSHKLKIKLISEPVKNSLIKWFTVLKFDFMVLFFETID